MRQQVTFTDPKTGDIYVWPVNPGYDEIQPAQKQRQIERTSNTGNVGAMKQQGDDGPFVIQWEPSIYERAHELALWHWYKLSRKQSIYLTDFDGEEFEGQIITLSRQQVGASGGPGDINQRGFMVKYAFGFEVWRFISGVLADAGVGP